MENWYSDFYFERVHFIVRIFISLFFNVLFHDYDRIPRRILLNKLTQNISPVIYVKDYFPPWFLQNKALQGVD